MRAIVWWRHICRATQVLRAPARAPQLEKRLAGEPAVGEWEGRDPSLRNKGPRAEALCSSPYPCPVQMARMSLWLMRGWGVRCVLPVPDPGNAPLLEMPGSVPVWAAEGLYLGL